MTRMHTDFSCVPMLALGRRHAVKPGAVPGDLRRKFVGEFAEVLGLPEIANAARAVETQL